MRRAALIAIMSAALAGPVMAQPIIQFDFGPAPARGSFWEHAPPDLGERIRLTQNRMRQLHTSGIIVGPEWQQDATEIEHISILHSELLGHQGRLTPEQHNWLWGRLDRLSRQLHWQATLGY